MDMVAELAPAFTFCFLTVGAFHHKMMPPHMCTQNPYAKKTQGAFLYIEDDKAEGKQQKGSS